MNGEVKGLWMRKDKYENIYRILQMEDLSLSFILGESNAPVL